MTSKAKYLTMAILMTFINIPLFIYSQSLANRSVEKSAALEASSMADENHEHTHEEPPVQVQDSSASPALAPEMTPADIAAQALAEEEKPERFQTLATLYRPPLFGKCKKLFERFNRKNFPDKPYKAFVYSFDGETAYCADVYTDKGQQQAEEIVIRECKEYHAGSGKYSPCRIYTEE